MKKRPLIASAVLLSISYSCIIAPATGANNGIPVIKAISGQQDVKLNCPILGDKLVFTSVLWLPETEAATVIGAGAAYNHKKYQYLASTGQLWFKDNIIPENEGIYRCVVRNGSRIYSGAVQLLVKRIYGTKFEEEFWENLVRSGIAAGLAFATILSACLVYSCRYKSKTIEGGGRAIGPRTGHYKVSTSNASPLQEDAQISNISRKNSNGSVVKSLSGSLAKRSPDKDLKEAGTTDLATGQEQLSLSHLSNNHRKCSNSRSEGGISLKSLNNAITTAVINNKPGALTPSGSTSTSLVSIGVNTTTLPSGVGEGGETVHTIKSKPGPTIIYITACED